MMATAEKKNGAGTPAERPIDRIKSALKDARVYEQIASVLPDEMKSRVEWFTNRAALTFLRGNWKLQKCTPASFVQCVVNGAELGLPIDGKLAYPVPYNNKKKLENGGEVWEMEAQFQPSYIGLKVIAKRSGQIADAYAEIICENDTFQHAKHGDKCHISHTWDITKPRGKAVAAYAVVILPSGLWRYEIMVMEELDAIQTRSKSKDDGPWKTDPNEMRKKTVLRRALKTDCSDPGFIMAAQYDEAEYEGELASPQRASRSDLTDRFAGLPAPRPRSQFEQDMDAGPQYEREGETVDAHYTEAEQPYQHREPEPSGDKAGPPSDPQFNELLKLYENNLKAADSLGKVEDCRKWAIAQYGAFDEGQLVEIEIRYGEARDKFKAGRGGKSQGSLMDKNDGVGQ